MEGECRHLQVKHIGGTAIRGRCKRNLSAPFCRLWMGEKLWLGFKQHTARGIERTNTHHDRLPIASGSAHIAVEVFIQLTGCSREPCGVGRRNAVAMTIGGRKGDGRHFRAHRGFGLRPHARQSEFFTSIRCKCHSGEAIGYCARHNNNRARRRAGHNTQRLGVKSAGNRLRT